jgi:mono/diheme cytochrome c family protein
MPTRNTSSGFGKFLIGLILGLLILPVAGYLYFRYGSLPVAVADKPFPFEKQIVHIPLNARIGREAPAEAPFGASEDAFEGGAAVYRQNCAACHGTPGHDVPYARFMYPSAPQLWKAHKKHGTGPQVTGVSDDPIGETYWKIANGIRLSGMPAYNTALTDTEIWQVSILLKNADQPLPDPVTKLLTGH